VPPAACLAHARRHPPLVWLTDRAVTQTGTPCRNRALSMRMAHLLLNL
jgi:hypothetical protein